MKPTDKELIEATEKGYMNANVRKQAMRVYFCSILPKCKLNKDAYLKTAEKFGVDMRTVQTIVANK